MKINPIAVFTTLALGAVGAAGYVSLKPVTVSAPVAEIAAPAPEVKSEEKVATATEPVKQLEPAPAPTTEPAIAPTFDTVRVETGGETVIAGRAEPGAEVSAKLDGVVIATATASADGSFVMIPAKPLPLGTGTLSLETSKAGIVQASTTTVAVAVKPQGQGESTVAVLAPDQPTKILQAPASPSNSVILDAVDYDAAGNIVFSGRSMPGTTVRLYVDNAMAGEVKSDDAGRWIFTGTSSVTAGTHTLRADALGAGGAVSSRVELPFLREQAATVAAATPAVEAPKVGAAPAATAVAVAVPTPVTPAEKQPTKIVIQPGNNLWTISRNLYGYGRNYTVIYEANKDQIRNPRLIYPGQIITAPVASSTAQ